MIIPPIFTILRVRRVSNLLNWNWEETFFKDSLVCIFRRKSDERWSRKRAYLFTLIDAIICFVIRIDFIIRYHSYRLFNKDTVEKVIWSMSSIEHNQILFLWCLIYQITVFLSWLESNKFIDKWKDQNIDHFLWFSLKSSENEQTTWELFSLVYQLYVFKLLKFKLGTPCINAWISRIISMMERGYA